MKKTIVFCVAVCLLCISGVLTTFGADSAVNISATEPTNIESTPNVSGGSQSTPSTESGEISKAISPAVDIIAASSGMAKAGIAGNTISFSEADFARAMNLARIESIKFISVPATSDGVLLIGNTAIVAGQSITRSNIGLLSYDPATEQSGKSSFEVSINGADYSVTCSLYMLSAPNANPNIENVAQTMLSIDGYADTAVFGKLGAYDPEGDSLTFQIVDLPDHGLVIMNDRTVGKYTYLPENGFSGRDSFTYVVYDKYGNYSSACTVSLKISEPSTSVIYTDMIGHHANCAAIAMTEKGIMSGTQVGGLSYFYPDAEVCRVDFLVMAMNAAGITDLPTVSASGFYDDASISASAMPYVAAAKQLGYIKGSADKDGNLCFNPDEKITRAEAALIVDNIMNGKSYLSSTQTVKAVFKDAYDIPAWAESSVETLNTLGILLDDGGNINAKDIMTKGQAAQMLTYMMQVIKK